MTEMRLLDLFSGTGSVAMKAREMGYETTSLDIVDGADICCDIMKWDYKVYDKGYFDIIWASPPCDTFSIRRRSIIGRNGHTKESILNDLIERGLPLLFKTREIIEYLNPKLWFIENPQTGLMKNYFESEIKFYDVDYCKYTDWGYRKRTRIWYGGEIEPKFIPRVCNKDCGYVINNRHVKNVSDCI